MRNALIVDGNVVNLIVLEPGSSWPIPAGHIVVPIWDEAVGIGFQYDGETFTAPPPPPLTLADLPVISDRQFFQALSLPPYEIITWAEALAAVKIGELPAPLQAIIDAIPDPLERYGADMLLSGSKEFHPTHPLVPTVAGAMDPPWTEQQIVTFWQFAASL